MNAKAVVLKYRIPVIQNNVNQKIRVVLATNMLFLIQIHVQIVHQVRVKILMNYFNVLQEQGVQIDLNSMIVHNKLAQLAQKVKYRILIKTILVSRH